MSNERWTCGVREKDKDNDYFKALTEKFVVKNVCQKHKSNCRKNGFQMSQGKGKIQKTIISSIVDKKVEKIIKR